MTLYWMTTNRHDTTTRNDDNHDRVQTTWETIQHDYNKRKQKDNVWIEHKKHDTECD